jgi:hypothetical protein
MHSLRAWDDVHNSGRTAQYPDNALIRFVYENYYDAPMRRNVRFIDLGAGGGASSWYLSREGFTVTAIEHSAVACEKMRVRFISEGLRTPPHVVRMDLASPINMAPADCIIDISAMCYLSFAEYGALADTVQRALLPGGKFFSIGPSDTCARSPYEPTGVRCFFRPERQMRALLKNFSVVRMTRSTYEVRRKLIDLIVTEANK